MSRYISQEKRVGSDFACFVRLSVVFFECYFKPFLCLLDVEKPKKFRDFTLSPHQGFVMDLTAPPPPQTPQLLFALRAYSYNLGTFGATEVDFFTCITPDFVSLRILFECRKIRTRKTPNTNTFYAVCCKYV